LFANLKTKALEQAYAVIYRAPKTPDIHKLSEKARLTSISKL